MHATVWVEVRNHMTAQWMYLPWCDRYVPPDTVGSFPMPCEWKVPETVNTLPRADAGR